MIQHQKTLYCEEETVQFAHAIAPYLGVGKTILLVGSIGAGKSFFSRAVIKSILGQATEVPSPTFTLVQTYETPDFDIWHCDLYRLVDPEHVSELGLFEAFETAACLVEWPDRLGGDAPSDALTLDFRVEPNSEVRTVTLTGPQHVWGSILDECRVA